MGLTCHNLALNMTGGKDCHPGDKSDWSIGGTCRDYSQVVNGRNLQPHREVRGGVPAPGLFLLPLAVFAFDWYLDDKIARAEQPIARARSDKCHTLHDVEVHLSRNHVEACGRPFLSPKLPLTEIFARSPLTSPTHSPHMNYHLFTDHDRHGSFKARS